MKYVFFDCDECSESSTPAPTDKGARLLAKSEGFVFMRGSVFCKDHVPQETKCTCGLRRNPVGWNRHKKDCAAYKPRPTTSKETEVLKSMLAGEELVQSLPGGWWLEDRQIDGRVGWSLLRKVFISEVQGSSPNFIRYYINEWGRDAIPKDEPPKL